MANKLSNCKLSNSKSLLPFAAEIDASAYSPVEVLVCLVKQFGGDIGLVNAIAVEHTFRPKPKREVFQFELSFCTQVDVVDSHWASCSTPAWVSPLG